MVICKYCLGTGLASRDPSLDLPIVKCAVCDGTGNVAEISEPPSSSRADCRDCQGRGMRFNYTLRGMEYGQCTTCYGSGKR